MNPVQQRYCESMIGRHMKPTEKKSDTKWAQGIVVDYKLTPGIDDGVVWIIEMPDGAVFEEYRRWNDPNMLRARRLNSCGEGGR